MSEAMKAQAKYIPIASMTSVATTQYYDVTDADIIVLLEMAGYGIAYWASSMEVDTAARIITVWDAEDEEEFTGTTFTELARALVAIGTGEYDSGYASYARQYLSDLLSEDSVEDAAGNIDSDLADHVVQYALFGKLVFG